MRIVYISLLCYFLQGCANAFTFNYQHTINDSVQKIALVDSRPAEEKEAKILSLLVSSSDYGIYRLGDSQIIPDRMEYLKEQLSIKAGNKIKTSTVTVKNFSIYRDVQYAMRNTAVSIGLSSASAALQTSGYLEKQEYTTYYPSRPNDNSAPEGFIKTEIVIEIDSKIYQSKQAVPYYPSDITKDRDLFAVIAEAIQISIDQSINEITSRL
jgi:hypothetical protein